MEIESHGERDRGVAVRGTSRTPAKEGGEGMTYKVDTEKFKADWEANGGLVPRCGYLGGCDKPAEYEIKRANGTRLACLCGIHKRRVTRE